MEINKFSSQLFVALEQVTVNVRRALNRLTVWAKSVPEKTRRLQESYRASELRKVFAGSLDAIVVTTQKIIKFRPTLVAALQQVSAHVRQALNGLAEWGKGLPEKTRRLRESYRASKLQKVLAGSLDAIAVTTQKVTKFRPQLVAALQQVLAPIRQALNGLAEWGKSVSREDSKTAGIISHKRIAESSCQLPRCDRRGEPQNQQIRVATIRRFAANGGTSSPDTQHARRTMEECQGEDQETTGSTSRQGE